MVNNYSLEDDTIDDFVPSEGILVFAGFIIICVIFQAIAGNTMTILSFLRDKQLRTTYNIYLVNLAFADLMMAGISMVIYLTYTLSRNKWLYGYHACKVYLVSDFTACSVTVILMNVISYDRLMLLRKGTSYYTHQGRNVAIVKVATSWIIAFLLFGPAIIGWDHWTGLDTVEPDDCDVQFAHDYVFTTTTAVLEFLLSLISLCVLNTLVIIEIRKLRHNKVHVVEIFTVQNHSTSSEENTLRNESLRTSTKMQNKPGSSKNKSTKKAQNAQKAARSLALLVIAFMITWAPYTILTIVISFCDDCVSMPVYETFTWILWFKAALNPFLYAFSSFRFRENFLFFMCCGKRNIRKLT